MRQKERGGKSSFVLRWRGHGRYGNAAPHHTHTGRRHRRPSEMQHNGNNATRSSPHRGGGDRARTSQRGERPHALHTCVHSRGHWEEWGRRNVSEKGGGRETELLVGRSHSSSPTHAPGAKIGNALALAQGFLPFLRKKIVPSAMRRFKWTVPTNHLSLRKLFTGGEKTFFSFPNNLSNWMDFPREMYSRFTEYLIILLYSLT